MSGLWQVKALDLFGAPDEAESTDLGVFDSKDKALLAAMGHVRSSLSDLARDAVSVADLISRFNSFGETTIVYSLDTPESVDFSGVDHAKRIARDVFQDWQETPVPPALRAAYRETHYLAALPSGDVRIAVGQPSPAVSDWLEAAGKRSAILLTAWNPMSRPVSSEENAARHAGLSARVRESGFPFVDAVGRSPDGEWSEASLLIAGVDVSDANRLARHFEQAGYVWINRDEPASLRVRTLRDTWVEDADLAESSSD
jgi:hypothetical protein